MATSLTKLHQLTQLEHSIWLDFISRQLIESGQLQDYINLGLRGLTSNPSIFHQAIANSSQYDQEIQTYALEGRPADQIAEALSIADIQQAADILRPVYLGTVGLDGYVSYEIDPRLARRTSETIEEVRRVADLIDRPNIMIKVPATSEGILAIKTLTAEGFNINVTLIFSLSQYELVAEAYLAGLEERLAHGKPLNQTASVASFFVSRIDVKTDRMLEILDTDRSLDLRGSIGIASAKMAYQRFLEITSTDRWENLRQNGAQPQRILFGSTSVKNPVYPDILYANNLIGAHTVNTLPPETLQAFLDHGTVSPTLTAHLEQAKADLKLLEDLGIDLEQVSSDLLDEGIQKFVQPHDDLIEAITRKRLEYVME